MSSFEFQHHAQTFSTELGWAMEAAAAAGEIIRHGAGTLKNFDHKGVGDLVSEIDQLADQAVKQTLQKYSALPILSEELSPYKPDADEMWIVDPLDGTSAYLMQAGDHYPSVLIAKWAHEQTQLGVAYFPLTDEWFYAASGCCAWKNGQRLKVDSHPPATLKNGWVEMNQFGDSSLETVEFARLRQVLRSQSGASLVTTTVPNSGVALRIGESKTRLVAAIHDNRADNVKQAPWDIAAVQLILQEAGGVFMNLAGERTDPFLAEVTIVARHESIAREIIELMQS